MWVEKKEGELKWGQFLVWQAIEEVGFLLGLRKMERKGRHVVSQGEGLRKKVEKPVDA